jgi:type VI secretion system FHA domain protein
MPLILTLTPLRTGGRTETRTLADGTLSMGRGPSNDWVLDDPERLLSKTHCILAVEGSRYVLNDVSTNGVFVNGSREPTRRDSRVFLTDGDQFRLGDFTVNVAEVDRAPDARRGAPAAGARGGGFGEDNFSGGGGRVDPLGGDDSSDPFGGEPGTVFHHPVSRPAPQARRDDPFDRPQNQGARAPIVDPDDDLFRGITPADNWAGPSQRDDADAPKQAFLPPKPIPQANPGEIDFDALLGDDPFGFGAPAPPPPPPPKPTMAPPARPAASQPPPTPIEEPPEPPAWPEAPTPQVELTLPPQQRPARTETARAAPPPPPATPAPPAAVASAPAADQAASANLLAAFLEGAGMPALKTGVSAEQSMRDAGAVFRALIEGLRETLMSRAAIKNELRVEQTMLRARDNNALKFSITPDEAVAALLLGARPGYKPPLDATREAFRDIQSHEMAVMAGVQTALVALLKRFDPAALEARLAPGRLDSILPSARRARIWELFCTTYKDIAHEAEDDFQSVFGREFARAYDAQMKKL